MNGKGTNGRMEGGGREGSEGERMNGWKKVRKEWMDEGGDEDNRKENINGWMKGLKSYIK